MELKNCVEFIIYYLIQGLVSLSDEDYILSVIYYSFWAKWSLTIRQIFVLTFDTKFMLKTV